MEILMARSIPEAKRMRLHSGLEHIPKTMTLLLALLAVIAIVPSFGNAQKSAKKLAKQDVINLLTGDVSSADVAQEARKAGISFQVTASVEKEIRAAGGTDDLIRVLRSLAPSASATPATTPRAGPATSPPVLVIGSSPGQSQVYVDDEPVGSTSQQGRLKLTGLAAGSHSVRISLSGYQDHEETVKLAGGETTVVAATLQRAAADQLSSPQPVQPAPQPSPPPTPSNLPHNALVSFRVAHDHGRSGQDYCVGVMSIGNGMIHYKSDNGVHEFEIPLNSIRDVRRNPVYLVGYGAFHIRTKKGSNFNFVALNQQAKPQPPDAVLTAIDNAMGR
jgi:hypothetical protein